MAHKHLFAGLVVDEYGNPVDSVFVGKEAFYVVDDKGFRRHIDSEYIDRQVLAHIWEMIRGHEELISEGAMKMIGQEDIFTKAMIETSLKNIDAQSETIIEQGIPEDTRTWLGMVGFRVAIDVHGNVLKVEQPGIEDGEMD